MRRRVKRDVVNDDMDDLVGITFVALPVVGEIERLRLGSERAGGLDDHEAIDQGVKLGQPDLQDIQLVEERETVEYAGHLRSVDMMGAGAGLAPSDATIRSRVSRSQ